MVTSLCVPIVFRLCRLHVQPRLVKRKLQCKSQRAEELDPRATPLLSASYNDRALPQVRSSPNACFYCAELSSVADNLCARKSSSLGAMKSLGVAPLQT
jgi:hypothetical protein